MSIFEGFAHFFILFDGSPQWTNCFRPSPPGRLHAISDRQREVIRNEDILHRFWSKDISLWRATESQRKVIQSNLTWVDLPEKVAPLLSEIAHATEVSMKDGLVDWVFLALGSSSLTARSVFSLITLRPPRRFSVLDSSHPCSICRLKESIDFNRFCFILSSKAGDKLEDHALFLYFQSLFKNATVSNVSQHFASLTESNSFLSGISRGYSFRASFLDPSHILSSVLFLASF